MKIIIARSGYSPTGGAERYLRRLVEGLKEQGIHTTLFNDGSWPTEDWPGDEIQTLSSTSAAEFAREVQTKRSAFPDSLLFSFERIPGCDVFRAGDGVHTSYLERLAAEEKSLATWFRNHRPFHRETCQLERQLYTENPKLQVICNSHLVARELASTFSFDITRTRVIPNGFTPAPWTQEDREAARQKIRLELAIPPSSPIVLFVGSGWKRKGAGLLASAFKQITHPTAHLVLVGKGRLKQALSDRIHLTGPLPDPRDHFLAADLFALPTLYDPFSNACLEASAYGIPTLTTDANGFSEALQQFPGSGESIPVPRQRTPWTEALDRWLAPEKLSASAQPLRDLSAAHSMSKNISETVALLSDLANTPR